MGRNKEKKPWTNLQNSYKNWSKEIKIYAWILYIGMIIYSLQGVLNSFRKEVKQLILAFNNNTFEKYIVVFPKNSLKKNMTPCILNWI